MFRYIVVCVLVALSAGAKASIVTGSYSGTITSDGFDGDNLFGMGMGPSVLIGAEISGQITIDTSKVPKDNYPFDLDYSDYYTAYQATDWLTVSMIVNGVPLDFDGDLAQQVTVINGGSSDRYRLFIRDKDTLEILGPDHYRGRIAVLELTIEDSSGGVIENDSLEQPLSWLWSGGTEAVGQFHILDYEIDCNCLVYSVERYGAFTLNSFNMAPTPVAVPLPPALLLFASALAGVGAAGRRRRKSAGRVTPPTPV